MDISLPQQFKPLSHYLKLAADFDKRDPVISYWCRYHAVQTALAIDKSSPEAKHVIVSLLSTLETKKRELADVEAVTNDAVAEAYIENCVLKVFSWADGQDRASVFNKNVVKAFYNAGVLIDVLCNFDDGQLSEEFEEKRRYAKWKAAYIHNCLKSGEVPRAGPLEEDNEWEVGVPPPNPMYNVEQEDEPTPVSRVLAKPEPDVGSLVDLEEATPVPSASAPLAFDQITKAQKYCKWAGSALSFDDVPSAIVSLEKALRLLKTGRDD